MHDSNEGADHTRRTVLKGTAGGLGLATVGSARAHDWGDATSSSSGDDPRHANAKTRGRTENADVVGYHSLGGVGPARQTGQPEHPHYGAITEIRQHGDYAYVGIFSSDSPTPGRGIAILDISDYNRAETAADLEQAELSVVSFLRNNNTGAAVMDVKVSDDGQYVFLSTQPYTALFDYADPGTDNEAADPTPNIDGEGFTAVPGGVVAVDVSDKANPRPVGFTQLSGTGSHNSFYHRIDGTEYIFAIHDLNEGSEGMYVFEFDRGSGQLRTVNRWRYENNNRQGEVSADSPAYIHDVEVVDDPRTGTPTAYLAYWPRGMWALDVSDPANIMALGHFDMDAAHFTTPLPHLVTMPNGADKRIAVASQEIPGSDTHTGRIYLVDCDGIYPSDPSYDDVPRRDDGVAKLGELDMWEWQNEYSIPDDVDLHFGGQDLYTFSLSPHNSDLARHIDPETGDVSFWLHQAHYGGGVRFLQIEPGTDDGLVGPAERFKRQEDDPDTAESDEADGGELDGVAWKHRTTDWSLAEKGFSRPTKGTPPDSRMEGLNDITPFIWGGVESNGVTFASDINQGVHAIHHHDIPISGADPIGVLSRADDASVFTAGQTNKVDLTLDVANQPLHVRDRVPDEWHVESTRRRGQEAYEEGSTQYVEFREEMHEDVTRSYYAEAPDSTGAYTFGPAEVSADGGETWHTLPGTTDTNIVVGASTAVDGVAALTLVAATAAGAVGTVYNKYGSLTEPLRSYIGREK